MKKKISPYEKVKRLKERSFARNTVIDKMESTKHFNERRNERIVKTELRTKRDLLGGIRSGKIFVDNRKRQKFYKII